MAICLYVYTPTSTHSTVLSSLPVYYTHSKRQMPLTCGLWVACGQQQLLVRCFPPVRQDIGGSGSADWVAVAQGSGSTRAALWRCVLHASVKPTSCLPPQVGHYALRQVNKIIIDIKVSISCTPELDPGQTLDSVNSNESVSA